MERKKKRKKAGTQGPPRARLIVTYSNGTWTDNLEILNPRVVVEAPEMIVCIEVAPRRRPTKVRAAEEALAGFLTHIDQLHTLQIGKKALRKMLEDETGAYDKSLMAVRVSASGQQRTYPANLIFGPDEVTLNLG